jgi:uncharacterized protein (DUF934 family)
MPPLIEIDRAQGHMRESQRDPAQTQLFAPDAWEPGQGLMLPVDAEPEPRFASAPVIAIDFPIFHDGRGLSLAVLLRTRAGFTGELRAVGDVHPELLHYLARCGFDSFVLPEDGALPLGDDLLAPYSDYYQASVAEAQPAFRRGRRGYHFRDH